jgi:sugar phosphate isomerase/epimerase
MNRRSFLISAGAGLSAPWSTFNRVEAGSRLRRPLGFWLDTLKREIQRNYWDTLSQMARLGYREIEFSETLEMAPVDFRYALGDFRLTAVAGGGSMRAFIDNFGHIVEQAHFFGRRYLVCYWPWLDDGSDKLADQYYAASEVFNRLGNRCAAEGLRFAFLHGDDELRYVDPVMRGYDILLQNTDPEVVAMYMHPYWMIRSGADPLKYIQRYPGRFELCRLVDMAGSPLSSFATLGEGIIDFAPIIGQSQKAGFKHFIVDQENATDPIRAFKKAVAYLQQIRF